MTLISFVTPVTPVRLAAWLNAASLWNWYSTSPVNLTQPLRTWTSR